MSQLIFSHGDILGMQKDRLSSTHGERLSLHIIAPCFVIQKRGKKKKKKSEILILEHNSINGWMQLDNPVSPNHIHHPDKNLLQTSRAATTSWRSIPGIVFTTETRQIMRWFICMELCSTVATLLYCI